MTSAEFNAEAWIERLAQLFPPLALAQEPFLREYQERHARVIDLRDGRPPPFPLADLRLLYAEVRNGRLLGMEAHYAPLRAVLDPVRYAMLSHPEFEKVAVTGRLIGDNHFSLEIPGSDGDIYMGTLTAGLMARAAELPEDSFRTAPRGLNAFLSPVGDGAAADTLGSLDEACDMFLFHGLTLSERIEVADGMVLLPYEEVLRFVDREFVRDFVPSGAGFHDWRPVGAVAWPFRWRPELRRRGNMNKRMGPTPAFFPEGGGVSGLAGGETRHACRTTRSIVEPNRRFGLSALRPGHAKSGVLQELVGRGFQRVRRLSGDRTGRAGGSAGGVSQPGERSLRRDGADRCYAAVGGACQEWAVRGR